MSENSSIETLELQEETEILGYLNIAFSNGFSKGTANVSPADMKKLSPLLRHYGKMEHPFAACVRDNRKRFGKATEKYCAVLKDLIKGTTKWRSTERKKNLSDEELGEFILHWEDYPDNYIDEFVEFLSQLTEEDVKLMLSENDNDYEGQNMLEVLSANAFAGFNQLKQKVEVALNEDSVAGMDRWVEDISDSQALVCEKGTEYYAVNYSVDDEGEITLADRENWELMDTENLEFSDDNQEIFAELYFTDTNTQADSDGLVWKTFLREGTWAYSPGSTLKNPRPMTITASGPSDPKKLSISMAEIKNNFDAGAIQHVTVPLNHDDKVHENTGFVKKLRFGKDDQGRNTLEAAIDFTEPDIKAKIDRGTIPNVSGGIHINYIDKEKGRKYNVALGHLALTPKPWLQGMAPFGVKASENLNVVGFSEVQQSSDDTQGGVEDTMTTIVEETTPDTFLSELNMSEDEVKAALADYDKLKSDARVNKIDQKVKEWEEAKKSPAVIKEAKAALLADENISLNLSDDGKEVTVSLSELVDRIVAASPEVALADDVITDEDTNGEAPPDDTTEENLSDEVKSEARRLFLYENYSEDEALAEAQRKFNTTA
jgi:hypothetical protein